MGLGREFSPWSVCDARTEACAQSLAQVTASVVAVPVIPALWVEDGPEDSGKNKTTYWKQDGCSGHPSALPLGTSLCSLGPGCQHRYSSSSDGLGNMS